MITHVTDPEPPPLDADGPDIVDLVKEDLDARRAVGIATYGTPLRASNGRRALRDLYAEMLDGVQYLRQEIAERETLADLLESIAVDQRAGASCFEWNDSDYFNSGVVEGLCMAARIVRGESSEEADV